MGFLKDAKAEALAKEATKAAEAGRAVFTPRLNMPRTQPDMSGEVSDWGLMVEAVEAAGWQLVAWSVGTDAKGRPEAYPFFRR